IPARSGGKESDEAFKRALSGGRIVLANDRPIGKEPTDPLEEFLFAHPEQTLNIGFVATRPELDDVLRHAAVCAPGPHALVPSFPAVLALRLQGHSPADSAALRSLARGSPDEAGNGTVWINYVGKPGVFHSVPLERLAADDLTDDD